MISSWMINQFAKESTREDNKKRNIVNSQEREDKQAQEENWMACARSPELAQDVRRRISTHNATVNGRGKLDVVGNYWHLSTRR